MADWMLSGQLIDKIIVEIHEVSQKDAITVEEKLIHHTFLKCLVVNCESLNGWVTKVNFKVPNFRLFVFIHGFLYPTDYFNILEPPDWMFRIWNVRL